MKNKVLHFLNTYKFCILVGVLLVVICEVLSVVCKDVIVVDRDTFDTTVVSIYLICCWPLLSVLHGIISCVCTKRVLLPSVVMALSEGVTLLIVEPNALIWAGITFVFSFVFALATKVLMMIVKAAKENW